MNWKKLWPFGSGGTIEKMSGRSFIVGKTPVNALFRGGPMHNKKLDGVCGAIQIPVMDKYGLRAITYRKTSQRTKSGRYIFRAEALRFIDPEDEIL
jgi:hypothetical protein